jgi:hypothetical protein
MLFELNNEVKLAISNKRLDNFNLYLISLLFFFDKKKSKTKENSALFVKKFPPLA